MVLISILPMKTMNTPPTRTKSSEMVGRIMREMATVVVVSVICEKEGYARNCFKNTFHILEFANFNCSGAFLVC